MLESLIIQSQKAPNPEDFKTLSTSIELDWFQKAVPGSVSFLFWLDATHFHFLAEQMGSPGTPHPDARPNVFQPELWKHDVAEFFLQSPDRSHYLEFNLSPNGAWWSCLFQDRLKPAPGEPHPIVGVQTTSAQTTNSWHATASIPRASLEELFPFDREITLNTTFILQSPRQIFLSYGKLGDGDPDFHRPQHFPSVKIIPLA